LLFALIVFGAVLIISPVVAFTVQRALLALAGLVLLWLIWVVRSVPADRTRPRRAPGALFKVQIVVVAGAWVWCILRIWAGGHGLDAALVTPVMLELGYLHYRQRLS